MTVPIAGFVSTPEIAGIGDIQLQDPGNYRIQAAGPGGTNWKLSKIESPYMHGDSITGARKERVIMMLAIMVQATNHAALIAKASDLARAFEQLRYRVGLTWDDGEAGAVDYEWYCGPANHIVSQGEGFDGSLLRVNRMLMKFQIPREPIPIEGPF